MKPLRYFLLITIIASSLCIKAQVGGKIYGIYWNGSNECFASITQQTGAVNFINTIPGFNIAQVDAGGATFNGDSNLYMVIGLGYFGGPTTFFSINAQNGTTLYSPALADSIVNLSDLQYIHSTQKIYGLCWNNAHSCEYFGTINPWNGVFSVISVVPKLRYLTLGNTYVYMPDSNLLVFEGADSARNYRIYTIDILTGGLKCPSPVNNQPVFNLAYEKSTQSIRGIYYDTGQEYYCELNYYTGAVNNICTVPIQAINGANVSAFNTDSNQYVTEGINGTDNLYALNPATGTVIYSPVIQNQGNGIINLKYAPVNSIDPIKSVEKNFFIPGAFSPNNDGYNDVFYVHGLFRTMQFIVFDRWGNKVFESENVHDGWDGTYKGHPMEAGTYVWLLKATGIDGGVINQKGTVALVR